MDRRVREKEKIVITYKHSSLQSHYCCLAYWQGELNFPFLEVYFAASKEYDGQKSVLLGIIHKIRPLYESLYEQKWRKWKIFTTKNLHNNLYTCSIRVIMRIFDRKYFSFFTFLSVQTLIEWSYFVDDPLQTKSQSSDMYFLT